MSERPESLSTVDGTDAYLAIDLSNDSDPDCTVITVEGKDQSNLLMTLTGAFISAGVRVLSASITTDREGRVQDVFRVHTMEGKKVPQEHWDSLRSQILALTSSSSRSSQPAIYGVVAAAEVQRLRPLSGAAEAQNEAAALELAAAEMAAAAADLVMLEKEMIKMHKKGADSDLLAQRESARAEAAASLERKMAAMEAVLAARRALAVEVVPKSAADTLQEQMQALTQPKTGTGPACGTGYEILFQGFNWESHRGHNYYRTLASQVRDLAKLGITCIWLPPPSDSVSSQGYLPRDLYHLDCNYGTEAELRDLIARMHECGIKAIADIVINHRCASFQSPDGKWNKFGGRLAWDTSAICNNNPQWGGRGNHKTGDDYSAAPNIDHTQERIQHDISEWMRWLRNSIGFDGWRFDYVRGYSGQYAKIYIDATVPEMAFGEYWDSCEYTDGVLNYNQDAHRQRIINWCDSTGGTAAAFDFTTKGILQEAVGRSEYWRLVDAQGRPPGFVGLWPSRAITFIDNHDTGSTLNHWPFPWNHLPEGYAYILTHPGTPCVFCDHLYQEQNGLRKAILELLDIRRRNGLQCRSKVLVRKAASDVYAATIDDKVAMKIGHGNWSPRDANVPSHGKEWKLASSGHNFAVWELQ